MADLANSVVFQIGKDTREQKLWKAVLSQGVYEACSKKAQALPLTYGEMRSAKEWVDLRNKDFCMVCIYAGYDPRYIYRKAKRKIKRWFENMRCLYGQRIQKNLERPTSKKEKVTIQCAVCNLRER